MAASLETTDLFRHQRKIFPIPEEGRVTAPLLPQRKLIMLRQVIVSVVLLSALSLMTPVSATAADSNLVTISGRVTDPNGKPAGNARIWVQRNFAGALTDEKLRKEEKTALELGWNE